MRYELLKRHACLAGTILFAVVVIIISVSNWRSPELTYSKHIALHDWSIILFATTNAVSAVCLAVCLVSYIKPRWKFGVFYTILSITMSVGLLLIGFPYLPSMPIVTLIHQIASWSMLVSALLWAIFVSATRWNYLSCATKFFSIFVFLVSLTMLIIKFWFTGIYDAIVFIMEIGYLLMMLTFILKINYSSLKPIKAVQ
jgi:hypothetical protein